MTMSPLSLRSEAPERLSRRIGGKGAVDASGAQTAGRSPALLLLKFIEQMSNAGDRPDHGAHRGAIKSLYHRTLLALREELSQAQSLGGDKGYRVHTK